MSVLAVPAPGRTVTRLAARQVRRGAVVVALLCGAMTAAVAATYDSVIAGAPGGAQALAALATNPAVRTLFGEPVALDQAGGFTVWRVGTILAVLVGVRAALVTVRVLRGEEDAGRWELLLAGRVPLAAAVARHLAVLTVAALAAGAAVVLALLATGTPVTGAVLHGGSIGLTGAFFVGVGGLAAQLWPDRGRAAGVTIGVLIAGLLARMVGDGVDGLAGLRWLSPFGLVALVRPYEADRVLPLVLLAVAALLLGLVAVAAARRRDVRAGILTATDGHRRSRSHLLGSLPGFAVRSTLRPLAGWTLGVGAFHLLIGLIAETMTSFLRDNQQFADLARQAGFELDAVQGYVATLFTLLAVPLGGFAATRIAALAHAERARHLDLLLAAPVTRARLLGTEVVVVAGGVVVLAATAGVATWIGTAATGISLPLGAALAGAVNPLPVVALGLGAAVLALGWAPGAVATVGMLPTAGGFLLTVLADSTGAPAWVAALSPFDHLALVPSTPPDLPAAFTMTAVAAGLGLLGILGYRRRDIRGD